MFKYLAFKWKHSDLSRTLLVLSGGSLVLTRARNKKQAVCAVVLCEMLWMSYIQCLARWDIRRARAFDLIQKSDRARYEAHMERLCEIINDDPRRYWERMAFPLKLERITESTAKDVIRCVSRDVHAIFITDELVDRIYARLEHPFAPGPVQTHHLAVWRGNKLNVRSIPLCLTPVLDAVELAFDALFVCGGWRQVTHRAASISVWKRSGTDAAQTPIVVFAGMGGHRFCKASVLSELQRKCAERTLYIFELPFTEVKDTVRHMRVRLPHQETVLARAADLQRHRIGLRDGVHDQQVQGEELYDPEQQPRRAVD